MDQNICKYESSNKQEDELLQKVCDQKFRLDKLIFPEKEMLTQAI